MLIPLSWLKEYVAIKIPFKELAEKLSAVGLTVEIWHEDPPAGGGEIIFDPEVTPNRPDWMSITGIAREISAVTGTKLKLPEPKMPWEKPKKKLEIKLSGNTKICPKVSTVLISGVKVKPSPDWLQKRIKQIGLHPINNLVDITNYVLWQYGNPLHVFDYNKIRGHTMTTELSKGGESFRSLDGIDYTLPKDAIIIKDLGRVIDLPPLKGGENTAISTQTTNILLHSIVCDPVLTRKASQALGLRSDSSAISERGVDPNGTIKAILRALELILELAGGELASEIIDEKAAEFKPWLVELNHHNLEKVLGIKIEPKKVVSILESLELKVSGQYKVTIPTFRNDLHIEEDLIEEVGRIYGYNNFPKTLPASPVPTAKVAYSHDYDLDYEVKQILKGAGYSEIYTYSLISEKQLLNLGINPVKVLRVDNPISRDYEYLRPNLFGNLLDSYKVNQANFSDIKLFELGKEYKGSNIDQAKEEYWLWGIESGENFYQAKGIVELLLNEFKIVNSLRPIEKADNFDWCHPGRAALLFNDKQYLGFVGEVHPSILTRWSIKGHVTAWELNYNLLEKLSNQSKKYQPVPKYPSVVEDLSLQIPTKVLYGQVIDEIKHSSHLIKSVELIDEHESSKTLRLTYQSASQNLTDQEVAKAKKVILANLKEKLKVREKE